MITSHHIVFVKDSQRNLNEDTLANNNRHILKAITKSMNANGWTATTRGTTGDLKGPNWHTESLLDGSPNKYRNYLHFTATHEGPSAPAKSELRAILKTMHTHGTNPLGGRWVLSTVDGVEYGIASDGEAVSAKDFTAYADFDVPEDFATAFDHLYGLDSHISRVRGALETAQLSQFTKRFHVALIGPPGCGKSDICETLADVFGPEAVLKFDGTQTTAAGAIKQLDELDLLPRVMIVEEIEKVAPEALSYLLALMDLRGEIRKTTAKNKIAKEARIVVVATVNNHELFDKMLAGAISSRFANKVWFHRPSEEVTRRILAREIESVDGDLAWIDPVIKYAQAKDITDPRMLTALALCGRDGWLDGSYERELADTDKPDDYTN